MPFKSQAQRRFLFSQHPDIAKKWIDKYGMPKELPEKVKKSKSKYELLLKGTK